MKIMIHMCIYL